MRLRCTITLRSNTMSSHVALVFFTSCATTFSRIFRHRASARKATASISAKAMNWSSISAREGDMPHPIKRSSIFFNISIIVCLS